MFASCRVSDSFFAAVRGALDSLREDTQLLSTVWRNGVTCRGWRKQTVEPQLLQRYPVVLALRPHLTSAGCRQCCCWWSAAAACPPASPAHPALPGTRPALLPAPCDEAHTAATAVCGHIVVSRCERHTAVGWMPDFRRVRQRLGGVGAANLTPTQSLRTHKHPYLKHTQTHL